MGWPKKNEGLKLYFERKNKSYLIIDSELSENGSYEGISETLINNNPKNPMLSSTGVSLSYLYHHCRRVSWPEMPLVWQNAIGQWLKDPMQYRGLWRVGEKEEHQKIQSISKENLPLYINEKWLFKTSQLTYENRLKYASIQ